jgi:hypothetical protein
MQACIWSFTQAKGSVNLGRGSESVWGGNGIAFVMRSMQPLAWHGLKRPRGRAWIPMWYGPDVPTSPQLGERYDFLDLGLFRAPRLTPIE